jgi:GNAT superfamily N-acetyltransferase
VIRPATIEDDERCIALAAEGGAPGITAAYLAFVRATGRLLVDDDVAFAGTVPVGSTAMLTDLFVAEIARGSGVGGRLLAAVLDGWTSRQTFSSSHPAALPAYSRASMTPRWRSLYLEGSATGGGPALSAEPWAHDRVDLVEHLATRPSIITADAVVEMRGEHLAVVRRLDSTDAPAVMEQVLRAFPPTTTIRAVVPEWHPLATWLQRRDFVVTDADTFCASADVVWSPTLAVYHPGLA